MPRKEYATSTTSYLASFDFVAKSNDEGGLVSISKPVASVQNDLGKFIRKVLVFSMQNYIVWKTCVFFSSKLYDIILVILSGVAKGNDPSLRPSRQNSR